MHNCTARSVARSPVFQLTFGKSEARSMASRPPRTCGSSHHNESRGQYGKYLVVSRKKYKELRRRPELRGTDSDGLSSFVSFNSFDAQRFFYICSVFGTKMYFFLFRPGSMLVILLHVIDPTCMDRWCYRNTADQCPLIASADASSNLARSIPRPSPPRYWTRARTP